MTKKDEEKTAFHTEEEVFYYTKMPFGLKNAGATYQRLVDSDFKEQLGVNLEAYVDDMVIKIQTEQDIIRDKGETVMMYLDAADEGVSAVLLMERYGRQMPIHYAIKEVLSGSSDQGAYDMQYVPRVAVKGQVLADFLADILMEINVAPVVASTPRVEDIPESSNARENLTPGPRAFQITHIPRVENRKAGALSKLATVQFDHLSK
ncbi:hypothetical protein Tco_1423154 [Tanacetum coccineum]